LGFAQLLRIDVHLPPPEFPLPPRLLGQAALLAQGAALLGHQVGVIVRVPALTGIAFMMVRVARRQTMVSIKNTFLISYLLHHRVAKFVIQLNKHVNRGIVLDN